jgi:hypothetical protein
MFEVWRLDFKVLQQPNYCNVNFINPDFPLLLSIFPTGQSPDISILYLPVYEKMKIECGSPKTVIPNIWKTLGIAYREIQFSD